MPDGYVMHCNCVGQRINITLAQERLLSQYNDLRFNNSFLAVLDTHDLMGGTTYQRRPIKSSDATAYGRIDFEEVRRRPENEIRVAMKSVAPFTRH